MNERELPADVPARVLKSLLKKPGQTRLKSHKNRVVINEKLNEFFAADYIILIKEECCADYEEECDCCCQEPEMIRLGNCKECRADMTRNNISNNTPVDPRYAVGNNEKIRNGQIHGVVGSDCENTTDVTIRRDNRQVGFGSEESQEEDDEDDDEEEEEDEEVDEDEEDDEEEEVDDDEDEEIENSDVFHRRQEMGKCKVTNCTTPLQKSQQQLQRPQQQMETLSPPEGYKDVCDEDATLGGDQQQQQQQQQQRLVCGECNYYHRQRSAGTATDDSNEPKIPTQDTETKNGKEIVKHEDDSDQLKNDQAQQTTPDLHQRYLVETITLTTVTERRIVREISEEETRPVSNEDADSANANEAIENAKNFVDKNIANDEARLDEDNDNKALQQQQQQQQPQQQQQQLQQSQTQTTEETENNHRDSLNDPSELSLSFKLGNVSLGLNNSLKPNSAVRQLFPDPRFISPPPAPTKSTLVSLAADETTDSDGSEAQKFLITTESLRLFDAVKRSKMAGSRSDSSESESSSIKRTIERNALRRSLICKYETNSRKKNLRSKDLTLEERIRQLTCVDQDDDNTGGSSASETNELPTRTNTTMTSVDAMDYGTEFPVRTSPSGEERPNNKNDKISSSRINPTTSNIQEETMTTTTLVQQSSSSSSSNSSAHHHHHHHHHHHQSTYKRITDLFAQKKMVDSNLPDLGLGDKATLAKEYSSKTVVAKMNSDARKQFLASLAPLSCVTSAGVENREDYYQLSSKQMVGRAGTAGNRDSIGYNSDSSYSLEDIEAALRGEERNYKNSGGPPDVTRGTPTGSGPETGDSATDELLAFVEQDKNRTERLRRRYNEADQENHCSSVCNRGNEETSTTVGNTSVQEREKLTGDEEINDVDDDDELNDYGFNRRPSVRGIKPQFESTSEIVRQLRSRSAVPAALVEKTRASFHGPSWPYYEITGETSTEKQASTTFLLAAPPQIVPNDDEQRSITGECQHRDNTINRINTMQKQIDDIYQTIAETAVTSVQGTIERGSYLESTLPRALPRGTINDSCHRYSLQETSQLPKNGIHYHDQHSVVGGRMLRIAGGGDGAPGTVYNTLPTKSRRPQSVVLPTNYPCGISTIQPQLHEAETTKCYRTMYFVPYNGISDPTYQNIQRILPPHSSPNYANHIERYPYPRNGRIDQSLAQQQQQHQLASQQPRYYARTVTGVPGNGAGNLHLHLQSEDYRFATPTTIQHPIQAPGMQIHQHMPQLAYNNGQNVTNYGIGPPGRPNGPQTQGYQTYHHTVNRAGAADVQTQTVSLSPPSSAPITTCGSAILNNSYNGIASHIGTASSSSSNSSVLSSPTKIQAQRNGSCNVAERGVPEGAASAPSHDYPSNNVSSHPINNSFIGHSGNVPPPNTQNSVYYAMNV